MQNFAWEIQCHIKAVLLNQARHIYVIVGPLLHEIILSKYLFFFLYHHLFAAYNCILVSKILEGCATWQATAENGLMLHCYQGIGQIHGEPSIS